MSKIFIKIKDKEVFKMQIKDARKSKKGDYDIMINAGSGLCFDRTIAGNYFRSFGDNVKSISWHGFHEKRYKKNIEFVINPVLRVKTKEGAAYPLRHIGSITSKEPIPFPVCSVYIPMEMNVGNLKKSNVSRDVNLVIDADDLIKESGARFDIFVFGKEVDVIKFKQSIASYMFETESVDSFNGDGSISGPEVGIKCKYHKLKKGVNVLVRKISDPCDMFSSIDKCFSIVFHDPNDVYNLLNRPVLSVDGEGGLISLGNMQNIHEENFE